MNRIATAVLAALACITLTTSTAHATARYWVGDSGPWSEAANWDPAGAPQDADAAFLLQADATDRQVLYDAGALSLYLDTLEMQAAGPASMTLDVPDANLAVGNLTVGPNTLLHQSGGDIHPVNFFRVYGTYNVEGGATASESSTLSVLGTLNQSGGSVSGDGVFVGGTYHLSGGYASSYTAGGPIAVAGTFQQTGGTMASWLQVRDTGTYRLAGGEAELSGLSANHGRFEYTGGEFAIQPGFFLENTGVFELSGPGTRTVQGGVRNTGTLTARHTTARFEGAFENHGGYLSEFSAQVFDDIMLAETGYLVGKAGDIFQVQGDFVNQSRQSTFWDTRNANLAFLSGEELLHDFYLAGDDRGASWQGFSENFALGALDLTGNRISLFDGNTDPGAALYTGALIGAEIIDSTIANILGQEGLNLYYNPFLSQNRYLAGLDYGLTGGGWLKAVRAVPEAPTLLLLAGGLIWIGLISGNLKKNGQRG